MNKLTCQRCGHEWLPRTDRPAACPRCNSRVWDQAPQKAEKEAQNAAKS